MKIVFVSCFLCLLNFVASAQSSVKWGLQAGVNVCHLSASGGDFDDVRTEQYRVVGFQAGLSAEISLTKILLLRTGLQVERRGFSYEINQSVIHYEAHYRPYYLQIPAIVALTNGKLYAGLGPYVAYGLGGSYHSEWAGPSYVDLPLPQDRNIIWGNNAATDDFQHLDAGLQFEAGLMVRQFRLSAAYALGLVNMQPHPDANQVVKKNGMLSLKVGVSFGPIKSQD